MSTTSIAAKSSRWGWGIAALYISFVLFMFALVGIAVMQQVDLVEPDYYAKGQAFQERIDERSRTQSLPFAPTFFYSVTHSEIQIQFPDTIRTEIAACSLLFYRPSMMQSDFASAVPLNEQGAGHLHDPRLKPGFWRADLVWIMNGQRYRTEHEVMIAK